ncbi:hypothetical protein VNO80_19207 [Phaseolus coccineus]|uniref:Uncharacterized protein n=1 Tax=Phaseolus coccineus TaxID=3886 RepID=A0AAN9MFK7_PHACN
MNFRTRALPSEIVIFLAQRFLVILILLFIILDLIAHNVKERCIRSSDTLHDLHFRVSDVYRTKTCDGYSVGYI